MELHTIVGLVGVFCYLLAYALMQMRKLTVDSDIYACLNITGGICGLYSLSRDFNLAAVISQTMWLIFTLVGMHASRRRRNTIKNKLPPFDPQR
ncbi:cyclic nucleotide-binding protein [Rouxiella sp. T17]|uniref:CBU_0592 family membrane protein n=1 Tax=Rouxiella sp. T17 TaxID=3085684 RepID=UPI002FCA0A88